MARGVRFVFYLPSIAGYRDRVRMVAGIARKVDRGVLVTSRIDADLRDLDLNGLEIVEASPARRLIPWATALAGSAAVERLLSQDQFNVVHDTFGHLMPVFLKHAWHPGRVFLTSMYSITEWDLRRWVWPRYGARLLLYPNLRAWIYRLPVQRSMCYLSDCVVVQAPGLADRLRELVKIEGSRIAWIPNSVNGGGPIAVPTRQRANPDGPIQLLYVGTFWTGKGAGKLLDLLGRARHRGVSIRALVVGGFAPDDAHSLRVRISRERLDGLITVRSRVPVAELDAIFADSHWLFHVTDVDGSPRVVLEALSRGVPVIGSRHPGIGVLDPDSKFILFAHPFDPDELLNRLVDERIGRSKYETRVALGQAAVAANFSSEAVSRLYVALYEKLLCGSKPRS